jgi:peroxiredoxin
MQFPRYVFLLVAIACGLACVGLMILGNHLAPAAPPDPAAPTTQPPADSADPLSLVGKPAPDFKANDLGGKTVTLADVKGHVTVLDFWATWCIPCHEELPHLQTLYQQQASHGLKLFAVDCGDETAKVEQYVKENKLMLPVLLDPNLVVGGAYKVDAMPQTVVIGKDGKVRNVFIGFVAKTDTPRLDQAVAAAMAQAD